MVVISFSVFKDKLLSGEKDQTTRKHNQKRIAQMQKYASESKIPRMRRSTASHGIQIYWKQRAGGGKLFDAELTETFIIKFDKDGNGNTTMVKKLEIGDFPIWTGAVVSQPVLDEICKRDGFKDLNEMSEWFYKQYGEEMYDTEFDVIRFRRVE